MKHLWNDIYGYHLPSGKVIKRLLHAISCVKFCILQIVVGKLKKLLFEISNTSKSRKFSIS